MEQHGGHRERLRRRFAASGLNGFAPHEMLELLLTFAIPRKDTNALAHTLVSHFGSLPAVLQASAEDLKAVDGVGDAAATLLSLILPLSKAYQGFLAEGSLDLSSPGAAAGYCQALFFGDRYERFFVVGLDSRMRVLAKTLIASGDEGETAVYPRLILSALLRCGAARALIAHNHPSGEAKPSGADLRVTQTLENLLEDVSVLLYDHVIVSGRDSFSFREHGLLRGGTA